MRLFPPIYCPTQVIKKYILAFSFIDQEFLINFFIIYSKACNEDQLTGIKQLIQRKDIQIRKYSQIKVTDYDMIRFRIISEVQTQHSEQIDKLNKQIKRHQFMNNESMYEIKVLREKNTQYEREIEEMKSNFKEMEEEMSAAHIREVNRVYGLLEQEKLARKSLQKGYERQAEKSKQAIKKYHKQLQTTQLQLLSLQQQSKQNTPFYSNQSHHPPSTLLQLKQSQFALQSEKLKHQLKQKNQQINELTKRHKAEMKQLRRRIDELEKEISEGQYQMRMLKEQSKTVREMAGQQAAHKTKLEYEKKHGQLSESYQLEISAKDRQIRQLKKQIHSLTNQPNAQLSPAVNNPLLLQQQKERGQKLFKENYQLKQQLKKFVVEVAQFKKKTKIQEYENRQARTQSVQDVKDKLHAANAQIVTLLKDKIALNDKITKMKLQN